VFQYADQVGYKTLYFKYADFFSIIHLGVLVLCLCYASHVAVVVLGKLVEGSNEISRASFQWHVQQTGPTYQKCESS
jgi:hypothetical protein